MPPFLLTGTISCGRVYTMAFQRGDIIKEVWAVNIETRYLLILDKLEPRGLVKDRYRIYDIGDGETQDVAVLNVKNKAEYTLHFRPPKDKGK